MSVEIDKISSRYLVRKIEPSDINDVFELCKGNPSYFNHMHSKLTPASIAEDMEALPPNKGYDDKFYVGFFKDDELIAVLDLIFAYPDKTTAYIGFFMMNKRFQGMGIGTEVVNELLYYLNQREFSCVRLGYIKGNNESEKFWYKNNFLPTGTEKESDNYTVIEMQRDLK